jgi:hypothetical protein
MTTKPLCWSNAEWLNKQIEYSRLQFREAYKRKDEALTDFWSDRWRRLERHYKDLRGV